MEIVFDIWFRDTRKNRVIVEVENRNDNNDEYFEDFAEHIQSSLAEWFAVSTISLVEIKQS